jgi:hypothetical protein
MVSLKDVSPSIHLKANMSEEDFLGVIHQLIDNINHSTLFDHPPSSLALLWFCCFRGFTKGITLLHHAGINIQQYDNDGASAIYVASESGHVRTILLLIELGCTANRCRIGGASPLYAASCNGYVDAIRILSELVGGDVNRCENICCGSARSCSRHSSAT